VAAMNKSRFAVWMCASAMLLVAATLLSPFVGAEPIDMNAALSSFFGRGPLGKDFDIVFMQRLPRSLLGAVAGGALGVCGAGFQAVLRNPLATPYTLGVASAGALGAVAVLGLNLSFSMGPFSSVQLGALMGAAADAVMIVLIARRLRGGGTGSLLLAGVTMSLVCAALMMLIRYISSPFRLAEMDRWLMGGLDVVGYTPLASVLPLLLPGLVLVFFHLRAIDQLSMGRALAESRGVNVSHMQRDIFIGGSLVTAAVVSAAGPIGFVGLIVPHAVRRLTPKDHRIILPVCFAAGGIFLIGADILARTVIAPAELPVGILTAAVGGPIFLLILAKTGIKEE
jgi:iron complex transport system permease protein